MALNKKSCARIAAVLIEEIGSPQMTNTVLNKIRKAADTDNKSFRKTMNRIAKALKKNAKAPKLVRPKAA